VRWSVRHVAGNCKKTDALRVVPAESNNTPTWQVKKVYSASTNALALRAGLIGLFAALVIY
jgi:hypothetical protein